MKIVLRKDESLFDNLCRLRKWFCELHSYLYREWSNILPMQEKYLIHIRPPGDVMPDAFREIVRLQNATNAAILYDDSFGEMVIEM